jgi:DNA-binding NtrC family response regulator
MQPRLLAISGSLTGTIRTLVDDRLSIGRDESNQLCLIDTAVSRKHCMIEQVREQCDDIPLLALYFAAKYAEKSQRPFKGISREARRFLMGYSWPGNVRELENAIEHAIVLGLTDEILPEDLPNGPLEEQSAGPAGARYHDVLNQAKKRADP